MKALHISLTNGKNETRLMKQAISLTEGGVFSSTKLVCLYSDNLPLDESVSEKVELTRLRLRSRRLPKNLLGHFFKYIEFLVRVIFIAGNSRPAVVNIHSVSLLPIGYILKKLFGSKLIYDTHELETEVFGLKGLRKKLLKLLERHLIRRTDLIFTVSESISDWYMTTYDVERPIVLLNSPFISHSTNEDYFRRKFNIFPSSKIVVYQGGLVQGRGLELILDCFESRSEDSVVLVCLGHGPLQGLVKLYSDRSRNIFFHESVSPSEVLSITASADIGIHMINNDCLNHYFCMPNKLFEYVSSGLPVIVSNMYDMGNFVRQYDIGWVIESNTLSSLTQLLDQITSEQIARFKYNTKTAAEDHSWETQEIKMLKAYRLLLTASL